MFYDLLVNELQNYSLLKTQLDNESLDVLDEYVDFIIRNNLGIMVNSKKELLSFGNTSNNYNETPSFVDYVILDISNSNILNLDVIQQICNLKIKYLQIRFFENIEFEIITKEISKIVKLDNSNINEISIVVKYSPNLISFIKEAHYKISNKFLSFILHTAELENRQTFGYINLTTTKSKIKIPISCGLIDLKNVNLNRIFYLETKSHNSCLHKKISIDSEGNIRNCPSMPQSFGNIKDTTLEEALNHKDFKKYWNLTKDHIEVCKDCEFRYICTDCRAYTERTHTNSEGLDTSKPLKCGYDPYTGEWEEWSTNPLKEKAINYYGMQDLVKKK